MRRLPGAPPTDPDVRDYLIRFLGNQSLGTALAYNFAALQANALDVVEYLGPRERKLLCNRDQEFVPVNVAFVTSATQPIPPGSLCIMVDTINRPIVTAYAIVLVVPT